MTLTNQLLQARGSVQSSLVVWQRLWNATIYHDWPHVSQANIEYKMHMKARKCPGCRSDDYLTL